MRLTVDYFVDCREDTHVEQLLSIRTNRDLLKCVLAGFLAEKTSIAL